MRFAQIAVSAVGFLLVITGNFGALIVLLLFGAIAWLLAVLAMPIYARATMRVRESPAVTPVALDDPAMPETARTHLRAAREALVALGFEPRDIIHQGVGKGGVYLALFRHPGSRARAMTRVLVGPVGGSLQARPTDVELQMMYDNGETAELSNVPGAIAGLDAVPGVIRQMPHVREVARLHEYFLKLVAGYEKSARLSSTARVALPDDATMTSVYHDQVRSSCAARQRAGLLEPSGVPGVWRATWRMAFMTVGHLVSPGAEFFRRRVHARGERLQREFDGDASLTTAERLGTGVGWTMLIIGVAMTAIAAATSPVLSTVAIAGMSIAWWIAGRGGKSPGWPSLIVGGLVATLVQGVLFSLPYLLDGIPSGLLAPGVFVPILLQLVPLVLITCGMALLIQGYRVAAEA